ncbi:MAG TPA: hypothetical protein VK957_18875 [Lunatimonas sp.]|nr:hypothetical protein [Lunatimonas sp.]
MAQRKLSLAWETAIAPAPVAKTVITFRDPESSPSVAINGTIIEAVVTKATLDHPCADPKKIPSRPKLPQKPQNQAALSTSMLTKTVCPKPLHNRRKSNRS